MKKKKYCCPIKNFCPYKYDACYNPKAFCRVIEDTPEHFNKEILKNG